MTRKNVDRAEEFRSLYDASYQDAFRFAARRVPYDTAEDVVAEAFTVVWRRIDDCPGELSEARAWVFGIVRNCLLNTRRGNRRAEALEVRLASVHRDTHSPPIDVSAQVDFATAWQALTAADQEVLALHVFEELTASQAATVLDVPTTTYRMRLSRARRRLQDLIDSGTSTNSAPGHRPLHVAKDLPA